MKILKRNIKTVPARRIFEDTVEAYRLLVEEESQASLHSFIDATIEPGRHLPPNTSEDKEIIYYLLSGKAQLITSESQIEVIAGDMLFIPPQTRHSIYNSEKNPLRLLIISCIVTKKADN